MDPVTHATTGALLSQVLPSPSRRLAAMAGALLGVLPDIDYILIFYDKLTFLQHHRGLTHSLFMAPIFALLAAVLGLGLGGRRWFKSLLVLGLAVLASHLVLDVVTAYGTQLLSPFSRHKFALDWLFIIDPYLTGILLAGTMIACLIKIWGRQVGLASLLLAGIYLAGAGMSHHQALTLAEQLFPKETSRILRTDALPQPFSCRRWHLLSATSQEIRQAFVQLPWWGTTAFAGEPNLVEVRGLKEPGTAFRLTSLSYDIPSLLRVVRWPRQTLPIPRSSPQVEVILQIFREFSRYPLLIQVLPQGQEQILSWVDLRFSVPGFAFPFVLQLQVGGDGRLLAWSLGHGRDKWFLPKAGSEARAASP
jgi:inner membrane protein